MFLKNFFPLLATAFCYVQGAAMANTPYLHQLHDTTMMSFTKHADATPPAKKAGFFSRLKNKLLGFVTKQAVAQPQAEKKKNLGLLSIALILVGGSLFLLTSNLIPLLLVIAGLITGVKSVNMKRERPVVNKEKKGKKDSWAKRHSGLLVGLALGIGVIIGIIIIGSNIGYR